MKFIDLDRPHRELKAKIDRALRDVFRRSDFILGKDVKLFEGEFAAYCGVKYAVGVSSGTDALLLALKSIDIKAGDEVIVPAFTFIATALAVTYTGALPVFADIEPDTYCLDAEKLEEVITPRTKAIIPVHLFGHPADMARILALAKKHNLKVIEDAAQAQGAVYRYRGTLKKAGALSDAGCFSFYPTKNLGACGDAGAIVTNQKKIYDKLLILRNCGRTSHYEHPVIGYNARLDTLQAAILRVKLKQLDAGNRLRRRKAKLYTRLLTGADGITTPLEKNNAQHVYHLYVIRSRSRQRLCRRLKKHNVPFSIHYPIPLHLQKAYSSLGYGKGDFPASEQAAGEVLALPMHPYLDDKAIAYIARVIKNG
jgi:dTDP-4-amino-4,6-dideoxygalactose transaminase